MAKEFGVLFCRYEFSVHDEALSASEALEVLTEIKGKPVAHRKANPSPDERDTFLMRPRQELRNRETIFTWSVARQLTERQVRQADLENDDIVESLLSTDEIQSTKFLALPRLGVLAVEDRTGDKHLPAKAAISRMKSIFKLVEGGTARIKVAGGPEDVDRALQTWSLQKFSFSVRPFNPTPRKPGDIIDKLLKEDNAAKMQGYMTPAVNESMRDSERGLISETKGLADAGYGQIGAVGYTPSGARATLGKPKFDEAREKNVRAQGEPRTLKVYVPELTSSEEEEAKVVELLKEFFDERRDEGE